MNAELTDEQAIENTIARLVREAHIKNARPRTFVYENPGDHVRSDKGWWFYDGKPDGDHGPFKTEAVAKAALKKFLTQPREPNTSGCGNLRCAGCYS